MADLERAAGAMGGQVGSNGQTDSNGRAGSQHLHQPAASTCISRQPALASAGSQHLHQPAAALQAGAFTGQLLPPDCAGKITQQLYRQLLLFNKPEMT